MGFNIDDLEIVNIFSQEEKDFNRAMVQRALENERTLQNSERRGGKMPMRGQFNKGMYAKREYDFTSYVLNEFREKWGIQ